jgi:hypothetical protein
MAALTAVGHGRSPGSTGASVARTAAFRASEEGRALWGAGAERPACVRVAAALLAGLWRRPRLRLRCANPHPRKQRGA